jgi:putative membrane protein
VSTETPARFTEAPTVQSHFAWLRTRMALERTMMAWVRTSLALIGFGFAIVQFFNRMGSMTDTKPALVPEAPHYFGVSLIVAGLAALGVAVAQYIQMIRYLRSGEFQALSVARHARVHSPLLAIAALLGVIGFGTLFAVWRRMT